MILDMVKKLFMFMKMVMSLVIVMFNGLVIYIYIYIYLHSSSLTFNKVCLSHPVNLLVSRMEVFKYINSFQMKKSNKNLR